MYAVVNTGGKQYRVRPDEILRVEKIPGEIGQEVQFDRVLMLSDGENIQVGTPVLDGVIVNGKIVEQKRTRKLLVFKYKRRKRYRRKKGHRQYYTSVKIDHFERGGERIQGTKQEEPQDTAPITEPSEETRETAAVEE